MLTLYKTVTCELYLDVIKDKYLCHALTKLRVSSHRLRIETGRYGSNRIERHERLCEVCTSGQVEDEYHFLFEEHCLINLFFILSAVWILSYVLFFVLYKSTN